MLLCGYKYFEDMYPKKSHESPRYATFEEQMNSAKSKSLEPRRIMGESEKLNYLHDWKQDKQGFVPPEQFAWHEDWGPEPGEDGHNEWYKKSRSFMSYEEKSKLDLKHGVPIKRNELRKQELPIEQTMKGAMHNVYEKNPHEMYSLKTASPDANYSAEEKADVIHARDQYVEEWLKKPGVTMQNVAKKIGDHNGTAKKLNVKQAERKPEWEMPTLPEYD